MTPGAIVLAAGASRRFGSPKQLVRRDGVSLVRRAAEAAREAGCRPVIVVLGARSPEIMSELAGLEWIDVCINVLWREGMGSSIRAGVRRLRELAPESPAALFLLTDQLHVTAEILNRLQERFAEESGDAAACRYEGIVGPPAIFSSRLFDRLESLRGDEGARSLLRSDEIEVETIDFPQGAIDLDAPDDLK